MVIQPDIAAALAKANTELTNPHKDARAETGQFGYSYATLDAITQAIRPILAKHGLSVMQDVQIVEGRLAVTTTLLHASGQTISFGPLIGTTGTTWQQVGSGISYARRYQLLSALGLAAGDDDDAQILERAPIATSANTQVETAPADVGSATGNLARIKARQEASEPQRKLLGSLSRQAGYSSTAELLASTQAHEILGGAPSQPLGKAHASTLIEALKNDITTRNEENNS